MKKCLLQNNKLKGTPKKLTARWEVDEEQELECFDSFYAPCTLEKNMTKKRVGYWRDIQRTNWRGDIIIPDFPDCPDVNDFIDPNWDITERSAIIDYLKRGKEKKSWMGCSNCRICGCMNGSRCLTDREWVWPEGFVHYLEKHNVKPPQEFVNYVLSKK